MNKLRQHKKILTAFLLAIYTFIATPVSLWHHHKARTYVSYADKEIVKTIDDSESDANCPICHHHYSTFTDDIVILYVSPLNEITSFETYYSFHLLPCPAYSKHNKGPPFLL